MGRFDEALSLTAPRNEFFSALSGGAGSRSFHGVRPFLAHPRPFGRLTLFVRGVFSFGLFPATTRTNKFVLVYALLGRLFRPLARRSQRGYSVAPFQALEPFQTLIGGQGCRAIGRSRRSRTTSASI